MPPIVTSAEIGRPAAEVFTYATDPARFREWQKGVVDGHMDGPAGGTGTPAVGAKCVTRRRIGGASRPSTSELVHIDPPRTWGVRGTDGPIRAAVDVVVEPLTGARSRLTISVEFTGHGIGKILVPLMVRREARKEMPSPGLAWLCHPALTGLPAQDWDALIATLITLHDQQRETSLDKRRGHRPRLAAPGAGRRPVLTLADRLLATVLHQRLALPQVVIAALFGVRPETINKRIRDARQLLEQAGYAIQPGPHRVASLDDLYRLAIAAGIVIPPETKAAS